MPPSTIVLAALLIGVIAGLRTMTAPAAVSWAAFFGVFRLAGTGLAFLGFAVTHWVFTAAALLELVTDQLPSTPSRTTPMQFGARLASGALCGAALTIAGGAWGIGLVAGVVGAIVGTLGGARARGRLADAFHRDRPAAILEDVVAIVGAAIVVGVLA